MLFRSALIIGPGVFLWTALLVLVLVVLGRMFFEWLSANTAPRERLLIVGTNPAAVALARELTGTRRETGVEIVGFVGPAPDAAMDSPVLSASVEDIPAIVRERAVDRVVVSLAEERGQLPMERLLEMRLDQGIAFDHLAAVYEQYTGKIAVENLRPSWFIFSGGFEKTRALTIAKRTFDQAGTALFNSISGLFQGSSLNSSATIVAYADEGPAYSGFDPDGDNTTLPIVGFYGQTLGAFGAGQNLRTLIGG